MGRFERTVDDQDIPRPDAAARQAVVRHVDERPNSPAVCGGVRCSAVLGKQFVIFRMSTYPNPKKTAFNLRGYRTVIGTNTNRPNVAYFLELKRRVGVIGLRPLCVSKVTR